MSVENTEEIVRKRLWKNKTLIEIAQDLLRIMPPGRLSTWESVSLPPGVTVIQLINELITAEEKVKSKTAALILGVCGIVLLAASYIRGIHHQSSLFGLLCFFAAMGFAAGLFCLAFGLDPSKNKAYSTLRNSSIELEKLKTYVLAFNPLLALGGDVCSKQKMFYPESAKLQLALFAAKITDAESRYDEIRLSKERRVLEMRQADLDLQQAQADFERAFAASVKFGLEISKEEAFWRV